MHRRRPRELEGRRPELKRVLGPGLLFLFIVGDILGTGIYALAGTVAREVGGMVWLPFALAFGVALLTACSYLELVTKYPHAAGAALYAHRAFGLPLVTFVVAFAVMSSGITSAATAARAFAENALRGLRLDAGPFTVTLLALGFLVGVMVINLIGVSHSVATNVVLTSVELAGLLLVLWVGSFAVADGRADLSRTLLFETAGDKGTFLAVSAATSVAFFAMVGFEDSVNMAEETRDPSRIFPRIMITALVVTGMLYVLVSLVAVAVVPIGELTASGATPLLTVVERAAPGLPVATVFPFISMFAVANTALINLLMASRLLYGLARQGVLPPMLGRILPGRRTPWVAVVVTSGLAMALATVVAEAAELGGTTALLLLAVFTVVNVAVLVLRRDRVAHRHFRAPTAVPVIAAVCTFFLVGPWSGRPARQFVIALAFLALGTVLGLLTRLLWGRREGCGADAEADS